MELDLQAESDDDRRNNRLLGVGLVQAIEEEAARQRIDPRDLHSLFGLQATYWSSILQRNRSIAGTSTDRIKTIAQFLGRSTIEVMALAEILVPSDFVVETTIEDQLERAYERYRKDPHWVHVAPGPKAWRLTPRDTKVALILMYERLVCEELLQKSQISPIRWIPASAEEGPAEPPPKRRPRRTAAAAAAGQTGGQGAQAAKPRGRKPKSSAE